MSKQQATTITIGDQPPVAVDWSPLSFADVRPSPKAPSLFSKDASDNYDDVTGAVQNDPMDECSCHTQFRVPCPVHHNPCGEIPISAHVAVFNPRGLRKPSPPRQPFKVIW